VVVSVISEIRKNPNSSEPAPVPDRARALRTQDDLPPLGLQSLGENTPNPLRDVISRDHPVKPGRNIKIWAVLDLHPFSLA